MLLAGIAVENTTPDFDKEFTYIVSDALASSVVPGVRVTVPFGNGSKKRIGMVMSVCEGNPPPKAKKIYDVLDSQPLLNREMIELARRIAERTFSTLFEACKTMLPAGINYRFVVSYTSSGVDIDAAGNLTGVEKEVFDYVSSKPGYIKRETVYKNLCLADDNPAADNLVKKGLLFSNADAVRNIGDAAVRMLKLTEEISDDVKLTKKQQLVYDVLKDVGCATVKELCYFTGVTPAVTSALVTKGVAEWVEFETYRSPSDISNEIDDSEVVLSDEQEKAYNNIVERICSNKPSVSLLFGVTGSGKTSVYVKAIDYVLSIGKTVIVMVPEISLTPQTLSIFRHRYGDSVAVFHSALSGGERLDEWKRVKNGEADIVIGTRSAVFSPLDNIGLIIIDEEQEHTYKSEQSPRYDAVEVAKLRAAFHSCTVVLASATPSVESYAAAENGRYGFDVLSNRYGNSVLPDVITVDMLREPLVAGCSMLSQRLADELTANIEAGKQSILLINRRGYNTFVACNSCGNVITCPYCSISMTYHSANKKLMCHYCGYTMDFITKCPECGEESVRYSGYGTQKIEEYIQSFIPGSKVLRMDADTTSRKDSHEHLLKDFSDGKYNILIGTQMVAKGLDFPNVTLVGVISVDSQLHNDDFRALEKTFSLLTQVVGRSGRGADKGRAVIQTITPENEIIRLAAAQDYPSFYNNEIKIRQALIYPPYCDIFVIVFNGSSEVVVRNASISFLSLIKENSKEKMFVLGPGPARVSKVSNRFRYRLIIKCHNSKAFRDMLRDTLSDFGKDRKFSTVSTHVEVNPDTII